MLKYKRVNVTGLLAATETLVDMLSGMAGKNRRIVSIGIEYAAAGATDYLRVYRDADQICDVDLTKFSLQSPWLPMDLPLAEGQQCKVGVYGVGIAATTSLEITIGYEEAG